MIQLSQRPFPQEGEKVACVDLVSIHTIATYASTSSHPSSRSCPTCCPFTRICDRTCIATVAAPTFPCILFMGQISRWCDLRKLCFTSLICNRNRALSLWERSLTLALDVGAALFKPIDYLGALWPCPGSLLATGLDRPCIRAKTPVAGNPRTTCHFL